MAAEEEEGGGALEVLDRASGELLDVRSASDERLAAFVVDAGRLRDDLAEAERVVEGELLRRLDRAACWTRRLGDPRTGVQLEVKAPSPQAGATEWDELALERELDGLVAAGEIDREAAAAALERKVTVTFRPRLASEQAAIERAAKRDARVRDVEATTRPVQAGINALLKLGGDVAAAVERARVKREPPPRRARVKEVQRG